MSPLYTFETEDGQKVDRIVPYDTEEITLEDGRKAVRAGQEVPAKRNPAYGIVR